MNQSGAAMPARLRKLSIPPNVDRQREILTTYDQLIRDRLLVPFETEMVGRLAALAAQRRAGRDTPETL